MFLKNIPPAALHLVHWILCSAVEKLHSALCFSSEAVCKKEHLFLSTSGEELFLMSAACGFPSTLFDLFLESNVMIVANFEIWKHTRCRAPLHDFLWHISAAASCCFEHRVVVIRFYTLRRGDIVTTDSDKWLKEYSNISGDTICFAMS